MALSPQGDALVTRLIPIALDLEASAIVGIPAKDVQVLKRTLRQVFENLTQRRRARQGYGSIYARGAFADSHVDEA